MLAYCCHPRNIIQDHFFSIVVIVVRLSLQSWTILLIIPILVICNAMLQRQNRLTLPPSGLLRSLGLRRLFMIGLILWASPGQRGVTWGIKSQAEPAHLTLA